MAGATGRRVAVMNPSGGVPGGGLFDGSGAMEEDISRRTSLLLALRHCNDSYPLSVTSSHGGRAIFHPFVVVLRGPASQGYALLGVTPTVDVVTIKAPQIQKGDTNGRTWTGREKESHVKEMWVAIRLYLLACERQGLADIVLAPLGCGAFNNPPWGVAHLFRRALTSLRFKGVFATVAFVSKEIWLNATNDMLSVF